MYQRSYLWEIQPNDGVITARKLMPWVTSKTGRDIPFQESIYTFLYVFFLAITSIVIFY